MLYVHIASHARLPIGGRITKQDDKMYRERVEAFRHAFPEDAAPHMFYLSGDDDIVEGQDEEQPVESQLRVSPQISARLWDTVRVCSLFFPMRAVEKTLLQLLPPSSHRQAGVGVELVPLRPGLCDTSR